MAFAQHDAGYNNVCTCGKEFIGNAFPETKLIPDENGEIINDDGCKFRLEYVLATVKDGCKDCMARLEKEAEEKYYAELDDLPIEERLRRIERWIKNFRHQKQQYVEPPRY